MRLPGLALVLLLAAMPGLPAAAQSLADGTAIRPDDARRLERLDEAYGRALREALEGGERDDVAVLVAALSGRPRESAPEALAGDWSCRVVKVGGITPLTVYDPFRCQVSVAGGRVLLDKVTGSQRLRGTIHRDGERLVLLGAGYIAGDPAPDYAALPEVIDPAASPQVTAAPGIVEMTGPNRGRILFPYPMLESTLDVLVLSR